MNRILGLLSATFLALILLVPAAEAADPWDEQDEHFILDTGGDISLPEGQTVDVLVVVNGTATIEGNARAVFVVNGTANFIGSRTTAIVAIASHVSLDSGSVVSGNIRTIDSTVETASGAAVEGNIRDLRDDLVGAPFLLGTALLLIYLAIAISAIAAGLVLAGVAARQVRHAEAVIGREPTTVVVAGFVGLSVMAIGGVGAIVTVLGAPLGLGILVIALPVLLFVGYLVAGIWVGERIVAQVSPVVSRERPYLAALVGLTVVGAVSIVPGVGVLFSFVGFGAVVLLIWRVARPTGGSIAAGKRIPATS